MSKNLFETYEVNGRTHTDNLPKNALISIPKKQYIEYEQQKEEIERLNNIINETRKGLDRFYKEHSRLMWTEEDYIEFINCIDRELKGDSSNE